jgi:hypothetical protein
MQLVSCSNSFGINGNYRNKVLIVVMGITNVINVYCYCATMTVETGTDDISNDCCYCAFAGLVPQRSLKLGLSYLKTKACLAVLNLDTRPRALVQERLRGFGEAVRTCGQRCFGVR